ncbi:MAG: hypothetical protein L3J63_10355 [Geopsychrobacter sp.]|nr:hypothetical protein [Geopsychrobacter sp.]
MIRIFSCVLILFLLVGCAPHQQAGVEPAADKTGIAGQVIDREGSPVARAWVYAYRNTGSSLRGPADFGALTDKQGHYFLDMVEGRYYLIARWRKDGGDAGPPRAGDAWAMPAKNPVPVAPHRISHADFRLQGVQAGQPVLLRSGSLGHGKTGFTGLLLDSVGKPLAGAFALAYTDLDFRRRPDFTSAVVGSDGRFRLFLPAGGRYCLAARMRTRGQPMAGEPYGQLGDDEAGCLLAVENKLLDIGDIRLSPYRR